MTLVTPSKWLADLVKGSFLKDKTVQVIPNGIDLTQFKPTEGDFRRRYGLEGKKIVLGVASIWEKRKGLDDFYRLAELLDSEYQIVLVGLSKQQIKKLPANIIGITRTNSVKELAEIYSAADVFVNTTYEDNYPTVNLEAQACDTPVLTYQTGGSVESVPYDYVVAQGDIKAIIEKIKLVCNCNDKNIMSKSLFDKKRTAVEYLKLYKSILSKK